MIGRRSVCSRQSNRYDAAVLTITPSVMLRFAANLSMLYGEFDFLDRFSAAARDGFEAVEFLFPYAYRPQELAERLQAAGVRQVLFNAPPGHWEDGERGLACLPGREAEFREGFMQALEYAQALQCPRIHVMAGIVPAGVEQQRLWATYQSNLTWAAEQAAMCGREVLIEPINPRDMPGYLLNHQHTAHEVVQQIAAANLKVQMDLYHCQIVEGDVSMAIRKWLPTGRVAHMQIAGVPMRHEPDTGELRYDYLFQVIREVSQDCGWEGWIGCEYRPRLGAAPGATSAGLGWLKGCSA